MQHDSMFRCIEPACARTMPRSVNFCPYCGTAQAQAAASPPAPVPVSVPVSVPVPVEESPGLVVRAAEAAQAAVPAAPALPEVAEPAIPQTAPTAARPAPLPPLPPLPSVQPLPPPGGARPQTGGAAGGAPAAPPKRDPVRLRWWILALAALWGIWLIAKPPTRRIEAQMEKAIALAQDCKARDAQTELIALRETRATPEQLQQVQTALNDAAGMCTRKRQRDKAWREAKSGAQSALASGSSERARQRLRTFTRRWGEDDQTRALKAEIDARAPEHPRADEVEGGMMR